MLRLVERRAEVAEEDFGFTSAPEESDAVFVRRCAVFCSLPPPTPEEDAGGGGGGGADEVEEVVEDDQLRRPKKRLLDDVGFLSAAVPLVTPATLDEDAMRIFRGRRSARRERGTRRTPAPEKREEEEEEEP